MVAAKLIAAIALTVVGATGPYYAVVLLGVMANLVIVPIVGGVTLGLIARRWLFALSIATVAVSLIGTYLSLGSMGLPHGLKIFSYAVQLALVYLAARLAVRARYDTANISMRPA